LVWFSGKCFPFILDGKYFSEVVKKLEMLCYLLLISNLIFKLLIAIYFVLNLFFQSHPVEYLISLIILLIKFFYLSDLILIFLLLFILFEIIYEILIFLISSSSNFFYLLDSISIILIVIYFIWDNLWN
jgi:hypothetical protein